jgi:3-deoxy-7-phosphoheptulonate synthase
MIIVLKSGTEKEQIDFLVEKIKGLGLKPYVSKGEFRTIIAVIGDEEKLRNEPIEAIDGVEKVLPIMHPFKLVSKDFRPEKTVIRVKGQVIGGKTPVIMAGPCSVEDLDTMREIAKELKDIGVNFIRGGAFKPRTSPYSFQGLGKEGLEYLKIISEETGLPTVSEVMDPRDVELVAEYVDILQIGTRNMQNFSLLKEVGKAKKPVLLKRGMWATIEEFLMAAEYILSNGNYDVILCVRGIRTFERYTRNTFDIDAIPFIKELSHLPVIADPSHAIGVAKYVEAASYAAIAIGADGLIIEAHTKPLEAKSDAKQTIDMPTLRRIVEKVKKLKAILDEEVS